MRPKRPACLFLASTLHLIRAMPVSLVFQPSLCSHFRSEIPKVRMLTFGYLRGPALLVDQCLGHPSCPFQFSFKRIRFCSTSSSVRSRRSVCVRLPIHVPAKSRSIRYHQPSSVNSLTSVACCSIWLINLSPSISTLPDDVHHRNYIRKVRTFIK